MPNPLHWAMAGFRWLRKGAAVLREVRTGEQHMESARHLLARELRQNAHCAGQYEDEQWSIQNIQQRLKTDSWEQYAAEWGALRGKHPDLWHEVADAYDALERTKNYGAAPPPRASLLNLAERLEKARL